MVPNGDAIRNALGEPRRDRIFQQRYGSVCGIPLRQDVVAILHEVSELGHESDVQGVAILHDPSCLRLEDFGAPAVHA